MTDTLDERSEVVLMVGLPSEGVTVFGTAVIRRTRDRAVRVLRWA